ncbi:sulfite reductase subunit alpha [Pollutimonas bauzanensis]|uniref:NADPH--hemoprotein reductase n=1 Tax=Pollutimonas bauzanensis TaxID=658167 RepID=A0A1M5SQ39_9BURK|nr:sulfite reductase subunit alpha [Pollutimonas bauzanensis]SHH40605.1 sulfite reductase (NADPH) flavoprotein alpha-component [Pollutimonas bauzanensis]
MTIQLAAAITLLCAWLALVWRTLRKVRAARARGAGDKTDIAVIYASQTGTAKDMAQRSAEALGPRRATLLAMDRIGPGQLLDYKAALFIVSTYGEGDPPDMAQAFHAGTLDAASAARLESLDVALLALGDSSYRHYCGFGRSLGQWLERQGANFLFAPVLVDRGAPEALLAWQRHMDKHFQARVDTAEHYADWRLLRRRHMNPGSAGGACHELALEPAGPGPASWSAGDIAEVRIPGDGRRREYSIASTPGEGALHLLVRQHTDAGGRPGAGSHWLTRELRTGGTLRLRIRENALFHVPAQPCPAIFIGNGTGIAGLRSLLQARMEQGHYENWLVFGERQQAHDFHYGDLLRDWHARRRIQRLDLAFSRDQAQKHYVHHLLRNAAAELRAWIARGAIVYVCGSKDTMARDVDHAIRDILGAEGYAALLERGGYKRDVY